MDFKKTTLNKKKAEIHFRFNLLRIFILIVLILFVVNIVTPSKEYSAEENRSLAQRPSFSIKAVMSGEYFKKWDTYYSDQFTGRDFWMGLRADGKALTMNPESGGVYKGKKGNLFEEPSVPNLEAEKKTAEAVNAFVKRHENLNMYMMLIPDATVANAKYLPYKAPVRNQEKDLKAFEKNIKGVKLLDPVKPLKKAASKDSYIYYRTDHHWTSQGAYEVFKATAPEMGIENIPTYKRYRVAEDFRGTLSSKSGIKGKADGIDVYSPEKIKTEYIVFYPDSEEKSTSMFQKKKLNGKDKYLLFFGGNHPVVDIKTDSDSDRSLLVFKDSYANSYMQFLYPYFNRIVMVDPRYYYDNIETLVNMLGTTDVMFLYSGNTIVEDTNLADTLNAGIEEKEAPEKDKAKDKTTEKKK